MTASTRAASSRTTGNIETIPGFAAYEGLPGRVFALPGDRVETVSDRAVSVEHVNVSLTVDFVGHRVDAVCELVMCCLAGPCTEVRLDACELAIETVDVDGRRAPSARHDGDTLVVAAPEPLATGNRFTMTVRYSVGATGGLHWTSVDDGASKFVYTQGQPEYTRCWLPCVDHLAERVTSELTITVASGLLAVAGGELVEQHDDGRTATFRWRQDVAHVPYLLSFAAGDLCEVDLGRAGDVPLRAYCRPEVATEVRRALQRTPDMLAYLERCIGVPYPFRSYAQVVIPEHVAGGMENASCTHLSERILAEPDGGAGSEPAVLHELCHQWFGNLWTCADWSHLWLQEGFCRIFEVLWCEQVRGRDEAEEYRLERARWYFQEQCRYRRPLVPATFAAPTDVFDRHSYDKACLIMNLLHGWLGDRFWAGVQAFARDNVGARVTFASLDAAFERATGCTIAPVIGPLVRHAGHPELIWSATWTAGGLTLVFEQAQCGPDGDDPVVYTVPVEVEIHDSTGHRRVQVLVDAQRCAVEIDQSTRPDAIIVDPDQAVVGTVERAEPAPLAEQLQVVRHHPRAAGRVAALEELVRTRERAEWQPFAEAALRDSFWRVRTAAAAALAAMPDALAVVLAALRAEPDPRARAALVHVLAGRDEEDARAAIRVALDDPSPPVRAAAARVVARCDDEDAIARTRDLLSPRENGTMVRCAVLQGLAEGDQPHRARIVLDATGPDRPAEEREAAATALVLLRPLDAALERLVELLTDPMEGMQIIAVVGLTRWGGPRAHDVLTAWLPARSADRVRRAHREALVMLAANDR